MNYTVRGLLRARDAVQLIAISLDVVTRVEDHDSVCGECVLHSTLQVLPQDLLLRRALVVLRLAEVQRLLVHDHAGLVQAELQLRGQLRRELRLAHAGEAAQCDQGHYPVLFCSVLFAPQISE